MVLITIILGLILGAGWLSAEYNYRAVKTKNKLLGDRQLRLDRQIEELHQLLEIERNRVTELEELSAEAADYKAKFEKSESNIKRYEIELHRLEQTLLALRQRASSKEYFGNALSKVFIGTIDQMMSPTKEESEKLSESAKNVFRKAKKAINE